MSSDSLTVNIRSDWLNCLMWNMQIYDMKLLAECINRILQHMELLAEESQKWGLNVNTKKKTKIMPVTKQNGSH